MLVPGRSRYLLHTRGTIINKESKTINRTLYTPSHFRPPKKKILTVSSSPFPSSFPPTKSLLPSIFSSGKSRTALWRHAKNEAGGILYILSSRNLADTIVRYGNNCEYVARSSRFYPFLNPPGERCSPECRVSFHPGASVVFACPHRYSPRGASVTSLTKFDAAMKSAELLV